MLGDKKMGEAINNLIKDFSKNELIAYFLILWGITFFFSAIDSFIWLAEGHVSILTLIIHGLWGLAELGCTAILAMLAFKLLNEKQ